MYPGLACSWHLVSPQPCLGPELVLSFMEVADFARNNCSILRQSSNSELQHTENARERLLEWSEQPEIKEKRGRLCTITMRWWYNPFSLCLSGDESIFLCIDAFDHSQVCKKVQLQRRAEKKSQVALCPLSFSSVIFTSQRQPLQKKGSQVYNNRAYIHSFSQRHNSRFASDWGSVLAGKQFSGGLLLLRAACFARLFSITHELWIWCFHVSHPTMLRFSGMTRKCDKESFLSQRRPDSIRIR